MDISSFWHPIADAFSSIQFVSPTAGVVAAIIVPKLPPLSKVPDTYNVEKPHQEDIPKGKTPAQYGMELALKKAENAPGIKAFFKEGIENVLEMCYNIYEVN